MEHIAQSHSMYRFEKMKELLSENDKINVSKMASILRNTNGLKNQKIGYGNEKALNQLLAHHAIIFKPESKQVWVSSNPYQLGEFVAYDLNAIFDSKQLTGTLAVDSLKIPKDDFLDSKEYADYEKFRILDREIDTVLKNRGVTTPEFLEAYKNLNPYFWQVYYKVGKYYYQKESFQLAEDNFKKALQLEITTLPDRENIQKYLNKIKKKLK